MARTLCDPMAGSCNVLGAWHRMSTLCDLATLDNAETWWCDRVVLTPVSESCTTRSSSGAEPALLQRRSRRRRQLHVRLGCGEPFSDGRAVAMCRSVGPTLRDGSFLFLELAAFMVMSSGADHRGRRQKKNEWMIWETRESILAAESLWQKTAVKKCFPCDVVLSARWLLVCGWSLVV